MDRLLNDYLRTIEKHLQPMPASERIDIVAEIKSQMSELKNNGKTSGEIIARLGNPRELATAYLGEAISKNSAFSWRKLGSIFAYYTLAGAIWTFLLPLTSILGITLMGCGFVIPIAGCIKFIGFLFGYDISNIQFTIGTFSANAITFLPISILFGIASFFIGKFLWIATIQIIKRLSKSAAKLTN